MPASFPLFFSSPWMLAAALLGGAIAAIAVLVRRPALSRGAAWLCAGGLALLCLAAGGPVWQRASPGKVAVMVDLSPSTRTADYRTRSRLDARIAALMGKTPYQTYFFASEALSDAADAKESMLSDIPCQQTVYQPPPGLAAVVLFSDGRFDLPPAGPPAYVVIDPGLESPIDAAVTSLQARGSSVSVNISNTGGPRVITLDGTMSGPNDIAPTGTLAIVRQIKPTARTVSARLTPGDAFPENDQLSASAAPPERLERWWVGNAPPPSGWKAMAPAEMPTQAADYLAPAVIVLANVAASDLTPLQQQRLGQYVRELGGGLVILGGDRAFAAGSYSGTELEALSPLASTPPLPTTHWLLLADGSGSMADMQAGMSLWHRATDAIVKLIPRLPPDDVVSVGSFSDRLTWWSTGKSAKETAEQPLPPIGAGPHGPTNLEDVLNAIAASADDQLPKQLLLLTDADAQISDPMALATAFRAKKIHLHLLAIGQGSALPALQIIISATGGTSVTQLDPQKWTAAIQTLMRAGAPRRIETNPLAVQFAGEFSTIAAQQAAPWNHAWKKDSATLLAEGKQDSQITPAAAKWNVGEGQVVAIAFTPSANVTDAIAGIVSRPPHDPRYRVTWDAASSLNVTVDAIDGKTYLNGKRVTLDLSENADSIAAARSQDIPQTAPGRYELSAPAPRSAAFATVRVDSHVIERIAIAGRYAPEFDAIGNDHDAMQRLAEQTGGQVIPPRQVWPIDFRWPSKPMPLAPWIALAGACLLAGGLAWWKVNG